MQIITIYLPDGHTRKFDVDEKRFSIIREGTYIKFVGQEPGENEREFQTTLPYTIEERK